MDNLKRGRWTQAELKDLKKWFPHISSLDCARDLCRPYQAVRKMASRLRLKKTRKYMRSIGRG
ncbi:MAG: hypothetical protein WC455_18040 [Dehalococcoidia bacterium]|jgi:hypothetical protein